ncbi:MAG: hypothetical protein RMJ14_05190 [Nitrososphaerota archaeon]|nr:hypothetical protein [Aigarchaeota archaeon]MDW8077014.1 hypothetical protein [Nitrososphaerota archaeon]
MQLIFKKAYGFCNPSTLLDDIKRVLINYGAYIKNVEKSGEEAWNVAAEKDSVNILAKLFCTRLPIRELPAFRSSGLSGYVSICEVELYSDGDEWFNEPFRRRFELGLFRAGGV